MKTKEFDNQHRYICEECLYSGGNTPEKLSGILRQLALDYEITEPWRLYPTETKLFSEAKWLSDGVTIHLSDRQFVEDLVSTDIDDSMVCDVHLPYRVMEITIPRGIKVPGTAYEFSAMILIDYDKTGFPKNSFRLAGSVGIHTHIRVAIDDKTPPEEAWVMTVWDKSWTVEKNMAPAVDISDPYIPKGLKKTTTAESLDLFRKESMHLALAAMLYFQSSEEQGAVLHPLGQVKGHWNGFKQEIRDHNEKVKHFRAVDITKKNQGGTDNGYNGRALETGHWRRHHMRMLRDTRFRRNPNGSIRTVWVKASWIGPENLNKFIGLRKMTPTGSPSSTVCVPVSTECVPAHDTHGA